MRVSFDKKRSLFCRNVGHRKDQSSYAKFFLGRAEPDAIIRAVKLTQLWELVEQEEKAWDEPTYAIARAVASGAGQVSLLPPSYASQGEKLVEWVNRYRLRFGAIIQITAPGLAEGLADYATVRQAALDRAEQRVEVGWPTFPDMPATEGPTLREAVERYRDDLRRRRAADAGTRDPRQTARLPTRPDARAQLGAHRRPVVQCDPRGREPITGAHRARSGSPTCG
jgi:hypothetical protein